jgi:hypothetical protein
MMKSTENKLVLTTERMSRRSDGVIAEGLNYSFQKMTQFERKLFSKNGSCIAECMIDIQFSK